MNAVYVKQIQEVTEDDEETPGGTKNMGCQLSV